MIDVLGKERDMVEGVPGRYTSEQYVKKTETGEERREGGRERKRERG